MQTTKIRRQRTSPRAFSAFALARRFSSLRSSACLCTRHTVGSARQGTKTLVSSSTSWHFTRGVLSAEELSHLLRVAHLPFHESCPLQDSLFGHALGSFRTRWLTLRAFGGLRGWGGGEGGNEARGPNSPQDPYDRVAQKAFGHHALALLRQWATAMCRGLHAGFCSPNRRNPQPVRSHSSASMRYFLFRATSSCRRSMYSATCILGL